MAIRTLEELIDTIGQEYSWRIRELSEFKMLVSHPNNSSIREKVLCRSGVALAYSHWEGFVKKTGTYFLEFVANQRHTIKELEPNFVTLIVRGRIDTASDAKKYSAFDEVTKYILTNQDSRARIPTKNVVDTQSNLSTVVLKEILWCLGLEYSLYEPKEKLINTRLVNQRNHIAHGEHLLIGMDDCLEIIDEALSIINCFKNEIENAAITKKYCK
ncbi:hypothetical protein KW499_09635 [Vibrio fluvialis]|nr:hypothetical protein [Vibrio fluvialis]MBY8154075.1 hypothetical protein [Vibrio fluvialis]